MRVARNVMRSDLQEVAKEKHFVYMIMSLVVCGGGAWLLMIRFTAVRGRSLVGSLVFLFAVAYCCSTVSRG